MTVPKIIRSILAVVVPCVFVSCSDGPTVLRPDLPGTPLEPPTFPPPQEEEKADLIGIAFRGPQPFYVRIGETAQFNVIAVDTAHKDVPDAKIIFTSRDTTIATVDSLGRVTGRRIGSVDIQVHSRNITWQYRANVVALLEKITITPDSVEAVAGALVPFTVLPAGVAKPAAGQVNPPVFVVRESDGRTIRLQNSVVVWFSSDTSVATTNNSNAFATASAKLKSPGTAVLRATWGPASAKVFVRVWPRLALNTVPGMAAGTSLRLVATIGNDTVPVTIVISDTTVLRQEPAGTINAVRPGFATITTTSSLGPPQSASAFITVTPAGTAGLKNAQDCSNYWMPLLIGRWKRPNTEYDLEVTADSVAFDWFFYNGYSGGEYRTVVGPPVWEYFPSSGCTLKVGGYPLIMLSATADTLDLSWVAPWRYVRQP